MSAGGGCCYLQQGGKGLQELCQLHDAAESRNRTHYEKEQPRNEHQVWSNVNLGYGLKNHPLKTCYGILGRTQ